ncbi:MAG: type II toxin-antitoxin system Phd/YefM family antitoxin [Anaerolineae bacterium]|nr:type II toxin-antitoxin system Phd/YefM family antitoxin [Anaerolineae bacterium]
MHSLNISEAKSRFSELISRAVAGERFLIQRRERPLAVLINATEFEQLERTAHTARQLAVVLGQNPDLLAEIEAGQAHPAMAAFGLWRNEADLAALADEIYANRLKPSPRPIVNL